MSPTSARRRAERKKQKAQIWAALACAVMGLSQWIFPANAWTLVVALVIIFAVAIPMACNGYIYAANRPAVVSFLLLHLILLAAVGWWRWPAIKVSPSEFIFTGKQERFTVTVKNNTGEDRYWVNIPIIVPRGSENRLEAEDTNSNEEGGKLRLQYMYCYGADQYERLVLYLPHMLVEEKDIFTVNYIGGKNFTAHVEAAESNDKPKGFSDDDTRLGLKMNLGVCKTVMRKVDYP